MLCEENKKPAIFAISCASIAVAHFTSASEFSIFVPIRC